MQGAQVAAKALRDDQGGGFEGEHRTWRRLEAEKRQGALPLGTRQSEQTLRLVRAKRHDCKGMNIARLCGLNFLFVYMHGMELEQASWKRGVILTLLKQEYHGMEWDGTGFLGDCI